MGYNNGLGFATRGVAFCAVAVFVGGTLVGSLLPESGNILAYVLGFPYGQGHVFNPCFLAVGIAGVVLACAAGLKSRK